MSNKKQLETLTSSLLLTSLDFECNEDKCIIQIEESKQEELILLINNLNNLKIPFKKVAKLYNFKLLKMKMKM